jgi:2'-5' RNA ligase
MRLFTAVDLTDEARLAIAEHQTHLRERLGASSIKWVRPEHMHLTLVFIGETDQERAQTIIELMGAEVPQSPFQLAFGGVGIFPPRGAPRILWLGTTDGAEEAIELHRHVALRLERAGVARESRPLRPHLTLGRWRDGRPSDRRLVGAESARRIASLEVDGVTLYQSRLSSSGPTYTALAGARLRCP